MKNLEEKLSLMKWLHEQGLEPGMWYLPEEYDTDDNRILLCEDEIVLRRPHPVDFNLPCRKSYPWFPLEQVLELLPECISKWQHCKEWEISQGWIRYFWFDVNENKKEEFAAVASGDFHLAALRLLKQVMEQYPSEVKR